MTLLPVLPGLFKTQHPAAPITNVTQIMQHSFFGDKDHTGNEGCRKGNKDVPGNPDCQVRIIAHRYRSTSREWKTQICSVPLTEPKQALYGPGTLTGTLKLNNFDSVAFLLQFNDGYPMTIPEMAAQFYVVNPKVAKDGQDKIATIKCNNGGWYQNPRFGTSSGDNPSLCNHPTYQINR